MITRRRAASLGQVDTATLSLRCHFPFGSYQGTGSVHDGRLRVVNTGQLASNATYDIGPEHDVDILTWVLQGTLDTHCADTTPEHIATGGLHAVMTAQGCPDLRWQAGPQGAAFLQFWILADTQGGSMAQESRPAFAALEDGGFRILASGFPEDDPEQAEGITDGAPVVLRSRSRLLHATLCKGEGAAYQTVQGRALYLVVVSGTATVDTTRLEAGDGACLDGTPYCVIMAEEDCVLLLCDTAADPA